MSQTFQNLGASLLDRSGSAYAGLAAARLLQRYPDLATQYGSDAMSAWKAHLIARTQELAVAVEFSVPEIMNSSVRWARLSFEAREVAHEHLQASLNCLRDVLAEELPETAQQPALDYLDAAAKQADSTDAIDTGLNASDAAQRLALEYVEACLSGDVRGARKMIFDALAAGREIHSIYFEVLAQALREVGRLWHAAKIGVHEEHVVTSTTLSLLAVLADRMSPTESNGKTVVGAAIDGEKHELGVRMVMDYFSMSGWNAIGLGGSVPSDDLASACRDFGADVLVVSVTLVTNLRALREAIHNVRRVSPETRIIVGGQAFEVAPGAGREAGADAVATSAESAVETGARLVGLNG